MEKKNWHEANLKRVVDMLQEIGARHLSSIRQGTTTGCLDFYGLNGKVVIVQTYANDGGFEVWRPISGSMKVDDVLEETRKFLQPNVVYLYNGALMDMDGQTDEYRIPHLFNNVQEAQAWADANDLKIRVVVGYRKGDVIVQKADR